MAKWNEVLRIEEAMGDRALPPRSTFPWGAVRAVLRLDRPQGTFYLWDPQRKYLSVGTFVKAPHGGQ